MPSTFAGFPVGASTPGTGRIEGERVSDEVCLDFKESFEHKRQEMDTTAFNLTVANQTHSPHKYAPVATPLTFHKSRHLSCIVWNQVNVIFFFSGHKEMCKVLAGFTSRHTQTVQNIHQAFLSLLFHVKGKAVKSLKENRLYM